MKKNWTVVFCSFCAIICVISAISILLVKKEPMSVDWASVLVGILSLLVTVLAVFQAVNYFWFEKSIREQTNKIGEELMAELQRKENDLRRAVRSYAIMLSGGVHVVMGVDGVIRGILDALVEDSKSEARIALNDILDDLYKYIKQEEGNDIRIDTSKRAEYLSAIAGIKDDRIVPICKFIVKCKDINEPK